MQALIRHRNCAGRISSIDRTRYSRARKVEIIGRTRLEFKLFLSVPFPFCIKHLVALIGIADLCYRRTGKITIRIPAFEYASAAAHIFCCRQDDTFSLRILCNIFALCNDSAVSCMQRHFIYYICGDRRHNLLRTLIAALVKDSEVYVTALSRPQPADNNGLRLPVWYHAVTVAKFAVLKPFAALYQIIAICTRLTAPKCHLSLCRTDTPDGFYSRIRTFCIRPCYANRKLHKIAGIIGSVIPVVLLAVNFQRIISYRQGIRNSNRRLAALAVLCDTSVIQVLSLRIGNYN